MGRRGTGAWVGRAAGLGSRLAELAGPCGDGAVERVAAEAGLAVGMVRRYLDAHDHVRSAPVVRASMTSVETHRTLARLDPLGAAAIRDAVISGHVPLARIRAMVRAAQARASPPARSAPLSVDEVVDRFAAAGVAAVPDRGLVTAPATAERWIGLSADATSAVRDDGGAIRRRHLWALLVSPGVPGSPIAGLAFADFLLRIAAAAGIYDHVSVLCASPFETEGVAAAARGWWPSRPDRLSVL